MKGRGSSSRANANNHANQLNPNNAAYRSSRGPSTPMPGGSSGASPQTVTPLPTEDVHPNGPTDASK